MKVEICSNCGLCVGCSYAINTALKTVKENKNTVLFKEIVHNKNVNKMLEKEGIKVVNSLLKLPNNSTVILRAHGEPKTTYEFLEKNNINYVDCTCFNVKKIHEKVEEYSNNNYKVIIIGKHGDNLKIHPEVVGTMGWCKQKPLLVEKEKDLITFKPNCNDKFYIVCQTTFNIEMADFLINKIQKICSEKNCEIIINKSICLAQKTIQQKSVNLAKLVDFMIVVGGKNSSNTIELFNNIKVFTNAIFVEDLKELKQIVKNSKNLMQKNYKIGLTAGASTLKSELDEIKDFLINLYI